MEINIVLFSRREKIIEKLKLILQNEFNNLKYNIIEINEVKRLFIDLDYEKKNKIIIIHIDVITKQILNNLKEVRNRDKYKNEIIILSNSYDIMFKCYELHLKILDCIPINSLCKKKLIDDIKFINDYIWKAKSIEITSDYIKYSLNLDDIVRIYSIKGLKKIVVCTCEREIYINMTLKKIQTMLNDDFFRMYKSEIINKKYIKKRYQINKKWYLDLYRYKMIPVSNKSIREIFTEKEEL